MNLVSVDKEVSNENINSFFNKNISNVDLIVCDMDAVFEEYLNIGNIDTNRIEDIILDGEFIDNNNISSMEIISEVSSKLYGSGKMIQDSFLCKAHYYSIPVFVVGMYYLIEFSHDECETFLCKSIDDNLLEYIKVEYEVDAYTLSNDINIESDGTAVLPTHTIPEIEKVSYLYDALLEKI